MIYPNFNWHYIVSVKAKSNAFLSLMYEGYLVVKTDHLGND